MPGLQGNFTFDVQILSGKAQWTSSSRHNNATEARKEARRLAAGKKHQGVKILQEHYDFVENRFMEKTIFKQMRHDDRTAGFYEDNVSEIVMDDLDGLDEYEYEDYDDYNSSTRTIVLVGGVLALIATLLAIGLFVFGGRGPDAESRPPSDYFVYDLPPVITNIHSGGQTFQVRMDIQLELDSYRDADKVEFALAQIMRSVIENLQQTDADDLRKRDRIQNLRRILMGEIQKSMGRTSLHGVLFRNIHVH
ncbi:MAG: flagellar basal body-associated FliL family protein [Rhodospirillaceae bacterium]